MKQNGGTVVGSDNYSIDNYMIIALIILTRKCKTITNLHNV